MALAVLPMVLMISMSIGIMLSRSLLELLFYALNTVATNPHSRALS